MSEDKNTSPVPRLTEDDYREMYLKLVADLHRVLGIPAKFDSMVNDATIVNMVEISVDRNKELSKRLSKAGEKIMELRSYEESQKN